MAHSFLGFDIGDGAPQTPFHFLTVRWIVNSSSLSVTTVAEILFAIGAVSSSMRSAALSSIPSCRVCVDFLVANGEERCLRCSWNVGIAGSFQEWLVKVGVGDALAVKLPDGGLFDLANNLDVAEDGLAYELAPGTVNLLAEVVGFFQQSVWQS